MQEMAYKAISQCSLSIANGGISNLVRPRQESLPAAWATSASIRRAVDFVGSPRLISPIIYPAGLTAKCPARGACRQWPQP
jgi:hypothetical protein